MRNKIIGALAVAGTLLVASAGPAAAVNDSSSATISGGTLAVNAATAGDFAATLNGTTQSVTTTFSTEVEDARGTGAGWRLAVNPTQFSDGATVAKTLPTTALSVSGMTVTAGADSSAVTATPNNGATLTAATNTTLLNVTTAGEGMGTYTVAGTLSLAVPAKAYAATYRSTVTVDLSPQI